ncbi:MAG: AAA family ATPase [candidate division WOR-3 bacterium]|nr:AAA family ATPase [candidate division WOR-3 bacterium]
MDINKYRVPISELTGHIKDEWLAFNTTHELTSSPYILGQERAVKALRLGLEIKSSGYNIFVTGLLGTGRKTTVRYLLNEIVKSKKIPDDILYVNNFERPDSPILITLPPGQGKLLAQAMNELIEFLIKTIPALLESEVYLEKKNKIIEDFKTKSELIAQKFEHEIQQNNFKLVPLVPGGQAELVYVYQNQAFDLSGLSALYEEGKITQEEFEAIKTKFLDYHEELQKLLKKIRDLEKETKNLLLDLNEKTIRPIVTARITEIRENFQNHKLEKYLNDVEKAIIKNIDRFLHLSLKEEQSLRKSPLEEIEYDPFWEFRVNVLVDNSQCKTAPIIFENMPTYKNLFGTIERSWDRYGQWRSNFTKIKAGSMLLANGGYLILNAIDVLLEPNVWNTFKRALRSGFLEISGADPTTLFPISTLKPEPIPLDLKVILIGDPMTYHLLYTYDEDFKKIFKIRADFDWEIPLTPENLKEYLAVIKTICEKECLLPFDRSGIKRILEYALRLSGRKNKLSTRFNQIADILREANYWAQKDNQLIVTESYVRKAIVEQKERVKLIEEKIQQMINEGTIFIDTEGKVVGQVNGLSLLELGDYVFGKPSRITAKIGVGTIGVINIEREAELSGPIHNKGIYIISGYLRDKYAQDKPLTLTASICFEQSYSGVEGDSASSAELYALLSSLAELPIRQDLAVTGSINQKGEIQPVGGINEKIEGFYLTCKIKGLTGTQGVIIPAANINDLVLSDEIIESVNQNRFHIYAINTIEEGIEILTGVPAGVKDQDGNYPKGTVNYLVNEKLKKFAAILQNYYGKEAADQV